jgi:hypothetical protein
MNQALRITGVSGIIDIAALIASTFLLVKADGAAFRKKNLCFHLPSGNFILK